MGYRLYKNTITGSRTNNTRKSIRILLSWIDKRCDKCGRFISRGHKGRNNNVCSKCAYENRKRWQREEGRINHNISSRKYRDKIKALVV